MSLARVSIICLTKKAMPAAGTTYALTVNRCLILWTGNFATIVRRFHQNEPNVSVVNSPRSQVSLATRTRRMRQNLSCSYPMILVDRYGHARSSARYFLSSDRRRYLWRTGKLAIRDAISPPEYYVPPIHDCTPYQMHAIAARLKTGHSEPHTPKEERETTGNPM